jgi:excisionase family DNA binding protein
MPAQVGTQTDTSNCRRELWSGSCPSPSQSEPPRATPATILTVAEVAQHLRCSKTFVYKVIEGKVHGVSPLPAIFMGRRRLVCADSLELWKRANEKSHGGGNIFSSPKVDAALRT